MNLKLISALNRARLRRKVAQERALLAEMRENARDLLEVQAEKVARLQFALDQSTARLPTSADIAREIDRREKVALLASACFSTCH